MIEAHGSEATPHVAESVGQLVCVCDLDGTVLRSDATLSSCARDGLNRLISAGMGVTIASGRSLQAMRALLGGVELGLPVIGLDGTLISEMSSGRHLLIRALGSGTAHFRGRDAHRVRRESRCSRPGMESRIECITWSR